MNEKVKAETEIEESEDIIEKKGENESSEDQHVDAIKEEVVSRQVGVKDRVKSGYRQRRTYFRKKVCKLCIRRIKTVDYKDVDSLKRFTTDRGKILPRRITGTCAKHQRMLSSAILRARMIALLPFVKK